MLQLLKQNSFSMHAEMDAIRTALGGLTPPFVSCPRFPLYVFSLKRRNVTGLNNRLNYVHSSLKPSHGFYVAKRTGYRVYNNKERFSGETCKTVLQPEKDGGVLNRAKKPSRRSRRKKKASCVCPSSTSSAQLQQEAGSESALHYLHRRPDRREAVSGRNAILDLTAPIYTLPGLPRWLSVHDELRSERSTPNLAGDVSSGCDGQVLRGYFTQPATALLSAGRFWK
jgi:hypothetical protein